jgi:hypothetical protein
MKFCFSYQDRDYFGSHKVLSPLGRSFPHTLMIAYSIVMEALQYGFVGFRVGSWLTHGVTDRATAILAQ